MYELADILDNRRWLRCEHPFPHVVASGVFTPDFYGALCGELGAILARGLSEAPVPDRLSRNIAGYDAYGVGLNEMPPGALGLFVTPAWRDLVCGAFGIGPTPYVFAGVHHHAVGSGSGFIHNDFNPVWFPRARNGRIQVPDPDRCGYKTGDGTLSDREKEEVVRGVVVIFFLLNDGWSPGDGGEIGLYDARDAVVGEPAVACAPESNSLVAFECTPASFHAYMGETRRPRTSIIMWVHRTLDDAVSAYGEERLERWKL